MENTTIQTTEIDNSKLEFGGFWKRVLSTIIDTIIVGTGIGVIANVILYYLHGYTVGYLFFGFHIIDAKTNQKASGGKLFLRWFIKVTFSLLTTGVIRTFIAFLFWGIGGVVITQSSHIPLGEGGGSIEKLKVTINRFLGLLTLLSLLGVGRLTGITIPFSKTKSGIHDMIVKTYVVKK